MKNIKEIKKEAILAEQSKQRKSSPKLNEEDMYIWNDYKFGEKRVNVVCKFEKVKTQDKTEPGGYFVWIKANWIDRHPKYCACFEKIKNKKHNNKK